MAVWATAAGGQANLDTAGGLRQFCLASAPAADSVRTETSYDAGLCEGYLLGVLQAHLQVLSADELYAEYRSCPPTGVRYSGRQLATLYLGYADEHPEDLGLPPMVFVLKTFRDAWPCEATVDLRVQIAQQRLTELGYQPGPADGSMGPRTQSSIRMFQRDNGLPVDGQLNETTFQAIVDKYREQIFSE